MRYRRHVLLASTAGVLAVSLIATTPGVAPAALTPVKHSASHGKPAREPSVPTQNLPAKPGLPDRDSEHTITTVDQPHWPAPGRAEVAVPKPQAQPVDWATVLSPNSAATITGPAVQAGALPVRVGPTAAANKLAAGSATATAAVATPAKVAVELLGRTGHELRFRISRADGVPKTGKVSLRLDYSGFRQAFGGDWSTRLQVVSVPDCAGCTPVRLPSHNDGKGEISADVPAAAAPQTFALSAAASGPAGDSTATSLAPTATWQVGGSSGDFSWSYPMQVPPSLGGPKPTLALAYASGSVDGRTTAANSQASWVGAGFEFAPGGTIERRYASCASKTEQKGNNGTSVTGDFCWATDNATFTLNGAGGELVLDDQTQTWHSRTDDGLTIEKLSGADNGDGGPAAGLAAKGEYWRITDKSGTQYYFGLNKLPGASGSTNSAWTVPVAGNNPDEPCHAAAFVDSFCQQAYRWNLDYVVDRHGNTMSFYYDVETNKYGRAGRSTLVADYVRAGNLNRIEYGQQAGKLADNTAKVAQVRFETAERCLKASGCVASDYVDTPLDQECTSTTNCGDLLYPSFWTKKRLSRVVTEVWRGTAYQPVESWTFRQSFLDPNDVGRSGMLWLEGLTNTGMVGGSKALPEVSFAAQLLPNRLIGPDSQGQPALIWPRIKTITYGTGGQVAVNYLGPDCTVPSDLPPVDDNGKRCYPIKWTPKDQAERQDWFAKYVVNQVTESDLVGGTPGQVTNIEYPEAPAWRHDEEDGLVEVDRKTWSQWRGYEKVKVTTGNGADGPATVKMNIYYRGMDGDVRQDGTLKSVDVTDSTGARSEDLNPLAGKLREQTTYSGSAVVDRSITDEWVSKDPTATRVKPWGTTKAYRVQDKAIRQDQAVGSGWLQSSSSNTYDETTGRLTAKTDLRNVADPNDDVCTRYEYFGNPAAGIAELPSREQTVKVACDKPWTNSDVLSDTKTSYDPENGDKLAVQRLSGFDTAGQPTYQTVSTADYDAFGRVRHSKDALQRTTTVDYTPAAGGPLTATRTTQPNGQTATSSLDPAWGEETAVTDVAGRTTRTVRDPLGRSVQTWLPGNASSTPNSTTEYSNEPGKPGVVSTTSLRADGSTELTREFSDGLMRRRQTQSEAADGIGRIVTDYITDSRGQQVKQNGPYANDAPIGFDIVKPTDEKEVPAQKLTSYDALGRPQQESFLSLGTIQWTRTHTNGTGVETIEPPAGDQATTRITDLQGRLVELRNYHGNKATGTYDKTSYSYTPAGQLASVTDPAGNVWRYTYDVRGRKIEENDPDRGTTKYTYNDLDQVTSTTDARQVTLTYGYDDLGRQVTVKNGSTVLTEWTYDTIKAGSLTSATRYVGGNAYTLRYTGYDDAGRPTGTELVIPASEGKLAGTYPVSTTYTDDGQLKSTTMPALGGLPAETVTVGYDQRSRPISLTGASPYVSETDYTPYGETSRIQVVNGDNWAEQLFEYERGSHRLSRSSLLTPNGYESDVRYGYDPAGNIVKATDTPTTVDAKDTQCFEYDDYRRLTQAWTPSSGDCAAAPDKNALGGPAPYLYSWTFDAIGNRKSEQRITPGGQTDATYEYPAAGQPQPHAVQKVTTTGTGGTRTDQYGYDADGNLQTRTKGGVTDTLAWTDDGKLGQLAGNGKTSSYIYAADGSRILRKDAGGTTLFIGDTELQLKPDGSLLGTRYYSLGDQQVAVRTGSKLTWVSGDHHGTMTVSVDADTLAVQRRRITPYGEVRGNAPTAWPGQRGFVGGVQDDQTGLVHLGAREYDPDSGRFISADPQLDTEDPQQMNAYAYANNSPVTFSDPDGQRYVTETVTTLREVVKVVYKRITEEKERLVRHTRLLILSVGLYLTFRAMGWNSLANALLVYATYVVREIIRITRTIRELVKVQERVTRKLKRWVGDAEAKDLDRMLKQSKDTLRAAERIAARSNAILTWAYQLRAVNVKGGGGSGGGGAAAGGDPADDPGFHPGNNDPGDESFWKFGVIGGLGAAGGALACVIAEPCGIAALVGILVIVPSSTVAGTAVYNDMNTSQGERPQRLLQPHVAPWFVDWWLRANYVEKRPDNTDPKSGCGVYAMGAGSPSC